MRKVRCDEERPYCQRCTKATYKCAGYAALIVSKDPLNSYYPIELGNISQPLLHSIDSPIQNRNVPSLSKGATAFINILPCPLIASDASDTDVQCTDTMAFSAFVRYKLGLITSVVANGFSSRAFKASLSMEWDILAFMDTQYVDNKDTRLGSVITLSGTAQRAQATTCSAYAEHNWPLRGSRVVKAFQAAIDIRNGISQG